MSHPHQPSSNATPGTPFPFRGLPPGSTCLKQRNHVTIRSDALHSHDEGYATNTINSIRAEVDPDLQLDDSSVLDPYTLWTIGRSREMRIHYTIQGETTDDTKTGGDHMSITVPTSTRSCQILIPKHLDTNDGNSMTGEECTVGYISMERQTHKELMEFSKHHGRFSCEVDLTDLDLGPDPWGTVYGARESMIREFTFEPGHALIQPVDGSVNGFRATFPGFSGNGYPDVELQGERKWYGEIEMLVRV